MVKILMGTEKKLVMLLFTILFTVAALSPIFPVKAQGTTLTIITRHASDIQTVFETEFLQTSLASDAGVTDIIWKAPALAFWRGIIQAGGIDEPPHHPRQ